MVLDEPREQNDIIIESQGIKIVYEADLEDYVKDSVIDYSDEGIILKGSKSSSC